MIKIVKSINRCDEYKCNNKQVYCITANDSNSAVWICKQGLKELYRKIGEVLKEKVK